jgi:type I site-specific restriction endonuclease
MLDTGIDVPEVVNLVFFKQVRSKTKFWQMMGRGTRLCADLFGPGQDKEFFRVFDYCQNLEFFGASPELKEPGAAKSLSERLFAARLDLVRALDRAEPPRDGLSAGEQAPYDAGDAAPSEAEIQADALKMLKQMVGGLNPDNFIVRQNRRIVEKWSSDQAWNHLGDEERTELLDVIAPLPSSQTLGTEEAKRFDLLMFQLELALLRGSQRFTALKKQLIEIAAALEAQTGIPAIAQQAVLIEEIQSDPWWEGVTVTLLELVRLRLRGLVQHIEKGRKAVVYSTLRMRSAKVSSTSCRRSARSTSPASSRRRAISSSSTRITSCCTSSGMPGRSRQPTSRSWRRCWSMPASATRRRSSEPGRSATASVASCARWSASIARPSTTPSPSSSRPARRRPHRSNLSASSSST